jgi:aminomethyltransferase
VREAGPIEKLVPFTVERGIARHGDAVVGGGVVTSGTHSPILGVGIGLAYLPAERAVEGEAFEVEVRGKVRRATVAARPLVKGTAA